MGAAAPPLRRVVAQLLLSRVASAPVLLAEAALGKVENAMETKPGLRWAAGPARPSLRGVNAAPLAQGNQQAVRFPLTKGERARLLQCLLKAENS